MELRPQLREISQTAFPIRYTRAVVGQQALCEAQKQRSRHLLDFLRFQTSRVCQYNTLLTPREVAVDSQAQTIRSLEAEGIPRKYIPVVLGGEFRHAVQMDDWIRQRMSIEEMLHSHPSAFKTTLASLSLPPSSSGQPDDGGVLVNKHAKANVLRGPVKPSVLTKRKRKEVVNDQDFCRERNALYSRRLYHKRKLELLAAQEEVKVWQGRNQLLAQEQERLQGLLQQALSLINAMSLPPWQQQQQQSPIVKMVQQQQQPQKQMNGIGDAVVFSTDRPILSAPAMGDYQSYTTNLYPSDQFSMDFSGFDPSGSNS
uniref:BZIP domain-containing protein n=1 Tax=Amphora coffeiformis TaxID=265554 RepID=A0A7S3L708_9STRA